jgi:hypothetical protein
MSTEEQVLPDVILAPAERRGAFYDLAPDQLITLVVSAGLAILLGMVGKSVPTILAGVCVFAAGVGVAFKHVRGLTLSEWAPIVFGFLMDRVAGRNSYRKDLAYPVDPGEGFKAGPFEGFGFYTYKGDQ